jgi:hypothetical protein
MSTNSRAIVAGIAAVLTGAGLPVAAVTTAAAAHAAPIYCNTYGGGDWSNTNCTGGTWCNSYGGGGWSNTMCNGPGLPPGGVLCNRFGGNGWANLNCS